jgi:hypothetical protein
MELSKKIDIPNFIQNSAVMPNTGIKNEAVTMERLEKT